jgi:hypothetical protein
MARARIKPHKDAEYMSANHIPHQVDRPEGSIYVLVFPSRSEPRNINNLKCTHQGYLLKGQTPAQALRDELLRTELPPIVPKEPATEVAEAA